MKQQCQLLDMAKSSYYYHPVPLNAMELTLQRLVDEVYTDHPHYGSRNITAVLQNVGYRINRKKVQSIMRALGIAGTQPGPHTSKPHPEHIKFPYLLNGVPIVKPTQVWSTDITYIRLPGGFVYLCTVMDWYSRLVLSTPLSNTLEGSFCLDAFEEAVDRYGIPEIFNTDQGVQFSSKLFVEAVLGRGIKFSMDGRGRALDNVFIERLWRSLKYEEVYLHEYQNASEARRRIEEYFVYYNTKRLHQALGNQTPHRIQFGK